MTHVMLGALAVATVVTLWHREVLRWATERAMDLGLVRPRPHPRRGYVLVPERSVVDGDPCRDTLDSESVP